MSTSVFGESITVMIIILVTIQSAVSIANVGPVSRGKVILVFRQSKPNPQCLKLTYILGRVIQLLKHHHKTENLVAEYLYSIQELILRCL